jgi:hypothetical protein
MATADLRSLYLNLNLDDWRRSNPFSEDLGIAADVLTDPFATPGQRRLQLSNWLQGGDNQPCLFGRIAAAQETLHYCMINDEDILTRSDQEISALIQAEVLAWKRRSLRPSEDVSRPAHGFVLSVASRRLAIAAPDAALLAFSHKVRDLWGCAGTQERAGETYWETLFLENPQDRSLWRFTFSVDFFAAQGDGRWWRDHRTPGGIMFTANSVGHMRRYREWYVGHVGQSQIEWALRTAMLTIDAAADTPHGRATKLKELSEDRRPFVDIKCPFVDPDRLKSQIRDKDWTRYGGFLHTDLSIRPEFFRAAPEPSPDIADREYLQDFTYLYDPRERDHWRFMNGEPVAQQTVDEAIGTPDTWISIAPTRSRRSSDDRGPSGRMGGALRPIGATAAGDPARIEALLKSGERWRMTDDELRAALEA